MRVALEAVKYDHIFKTQVPFDSPSNNDARSGGASEPATGTGVAPSAQAPAGARGGRPAGGGKPKQSPAGATKTGAK